MKQFTSSPPVANPFYMLDWTVRSVELFSTREKTQDRSVTVDDDMVAGALSPHPDRPDGFSPTEAAIRDTFDEFLGGLQRFEHFVETRLIHAKDVLPYLQYWVRIIGEIDREPERSHLIHQLWRYIDFYEYDGVQRLFRRFGYDITPGTNPPPPPSAPPGVAQA